MIKTAKKALAFTLAASMAFSVAPVAPFSAPAAFAAETGVLSNKLSFTLAIGNTDADKTNTKYDSFKLDSLASYSGAKAEVSVADKDIALIGVVKEGKTAELSDLNGTDADKAKEADENIEWSDKVSIDSANTVIFVKALKGGQTNIKATADNADNVSQNISVKITEASKTFKVTTGTGENKKELKSGDAIDVVAGGAAAEVNLEGDNIADILAKLAKENKDTSISRFVVGDEEIAKVTYEDAKLTIKGLSAGATNVKIYINELNVIFTLTVNVIADTELTATIDGQTYTAKADDDWKEDDEEASPVIYLTQEKQESKIVATANNGVAATYKADSEDVIVVGNDGSVTAKLTDGKVIYGETDITVTDEYF